MGKGSQLTQLKTALAQSGLTGRPPSKKRKRSSTSVHNAVIEKEKRTRKLEEIGKSVKLNPFDVKVTKLKHEVGGRKVKGVTGRPSASKQAGLEKRSKLLLSELERKNRAGGVVDRRFGENDTTLTPEERMLERFAKERQRSSKGVNFNLEDDDEELTHYGTSLAAVDDFEAGGLMLEHDEDDELPPRPIDPEIAQHPHLGDPNSGDEPPRKKSRLEVMSEVISKSKEHKHLRQLAKDQDEEIRHAIDGEFDSIRELLFLSKPGPFSSGSNAIPLGILGREVGRTDGTPSDPVLPSSKAPHAEEDEDEDAGYDKLVHELAFDKRAKPKDRTKTEEEIAAEEAEKLRNAEKARLKRMVGEDASEDENDVRGGYKKRRQAEADDLEDDFNEHGDGVDAYGLGKGLGGDTPGERDLGEDGSSEGASVASEEDGNETDGEESDGASLSSDDGEASEVTPLPSTSQIKKERKGETSRELPFTFPCPATHDEFLDIVDGIDLKDVSTVIQRIRTMYHPSLAEENAEKLKVFLGVLIEHRLHTATSASSLSAGGNLETHIVALAQSYSIEAAEAMRNKLVLMQRNLVRGLDRGATQYESKTFPGIPELVLLRIIGDIWSTSDKKHPVVTPAMLLMGQYLSQGRVRQLADVASGLFLCTLFLKYQHLSKRLVPEAVNFLINSLLLLGPHTFTQPPNSVSFPPSPDFKLHENLQLEQESATELSPGPPNLGVCLRLVDPAAQSSEISQHKVNLLSLTYALLLQFAKLYVELDGFIELFGPVIAISKKTKSERFSEGLSKSYTACHHGISRMIKFATENRRPLTLQAHKPVPIPTYAPKFDAAHSFSKSKDPDRERNESAKLKALYRKEFKGAMRELRKDNKFLAGQRAKVQAEKDEAYKKKMAKVHGEIQVERAEEKRYLREKEKDKKRSGKRK